jgi:uncharacterized protein (TIGR02594 family)
MLTDPKWLSYARGKIGEREIKGPRHNPWIVRALAKLKAWWSDDETPWCGLFVAHCLEEAGLPLPKHWYRAMAWTEYGSNLRPTHVCEGAILVFARQGGGHVGFYVGEDRFYYRVLGGNQANAVNIMRIAKSRCVAIRWPKGVPVTGGPIRTETDAPVSKDEA